jgi:hypothetical protein
MCALQAGGVEQTAHAHCVPELLSIQLSIDSDIIRHREG